MRVVSNQWGTAPCDHNHVENSLARRMSIPRVQRAPWKCYIQPACFGSTERIPCLVAPSPICSSLGQSQTGCHNVNRGGGA